MFLKKSTDDDISNYHNDVGECLLYLYEYFTVNNWFFNQIGQNIFLKHKKMWNESKLAALWALKKAKYTETDFELICLSYASMIATCSHFGDQKQNIALEVYAFEVCQRKKTLVERGELRAVGQLYNEIFVARFVCYFYNKKCIKFGT